MAAQEQVDLVERGLRQNQGDLKQCHRLRKLFACSGPVACLLGVGAVTLGLDTAAAFLGTLGVVATVSYAVSIPIIQAVKTRIARDRARLEQARMDYEEAHKAKHGRYTPAYEVKLMVERVTAPGATIRQTGSAVTVGGIRLPTRG